MFRAGLYNRRGEALGFAYPTVRKDAARVSIVGGGMLNTPGIAATMFEALYEAHINIHMISTSEIKITVLIDEDKADKAVEAIHNKFFAPDSVIGQ